MSVATGRRTATRDVELRGQTIRAGEKVVVWYVSAKNFDEEVFEDPLRFDVGRRPNPHVTFGGGGPHYCLGPPDRMRTNFTNALKRMPVRVEAA